MSLATKAAQGAVFNIAASLISRVAGIVSTFWVTRFVAPAEYGEVLGAAIVAATCLTVSSLGLTPYLLAHPKASRQVSFHVTLSNVTALTLVAMIALSLQSKLGIVFKIERLVEFLPWFLLGALVDLFFTVAERTLLRDLRFRPVAMNRSSADLLYSACVVVFAWQGFGAYAIVIGTLARSFARLGVMLVMTNWRDWALPCLPRWSTIKELLRFGLPLWVASLASVFCTRWDGMITSSYFGAAMLGAYNLAYSLAAMPIAQVGEQVGDVLLPSFAQIDPQKRPYALARAIRLLGFIMFPLGLGLAAVSSSLVRTFFDPRWAIVAPLLSILSILSITRPFSYAVTSYFQSCSRTMILSVLDVSRMILLVLLMVLAARFGIYALVIAVGLAFSIATFAGLIVISREGIHLLGLLVAIGRPFAASAMMLVCVLGARYLAAELGVTRPSVSLVIEVLVGAFTWLAAARLVANRSLTEVIDLARKAIGRGKRTQGEDAGKAASGPA